jgi:hypothetical protein
MKPAVCAYWKVIWDEDDATETRYYSDAAYHQSPPFTEVGVTIRANVIGNVIKDATFELNPDLKTEKINLTFSNIQTKDADGNDFEPEERMSTRFQTYRSGVRCELVYFYPNEGSTAITESVWFGILQAPEIYGIQTVKTTATNGFRSREQKIPRRTRPRECTANFGAWMPDTFAVESNGCPYDRHLGGSMGNLDPATGEPYLDCPRDSTTTCNTRLGTTDGKYFLGFNTQGGAVFGNTSRGEIYVSKGNTSALKEPIRVIAGTKYLRGLQVLAFRRERDNNHPVNSFISGILEVGEGPVEDISGVKVKEQVIAPMHLNIRLGALGQPPSSYAPGISNFSGTGHIYARYGWIDLTDPTSAGPSDMEGECLVKGYNKVAVFTDSSTYTRIWTDNRVWWLMELMTNQRFGMAYSKDRFEIADWIDRAAWAEDWVRFTAVFKDGEEVVYRGQRTKLDAALEGRAVAEQIEDICRTGSLSLPIQSEGKFTIRSFEAITDAQYDALKTFTDTGGNRNICTSDGVPKLELSQVPDDKVINEVVVTFEEDQNTDVARPVTVDDPDQKLKAGRALGENNLQPVPKQYSAFGARTAQEAIRLAHRLLRFGDESNPDEKGGTQNNLRAVLTVPFVQTLGLTRYDFIRIDSSLLDEFEIGTGDWIITPDVFRILRMKKLANDTVEITAQAYNDAAYLEMDIVTLDSTSGTGYITIAGGGSEETNVVCSYSGDFNSRPAYRSGAVLVWWTGTTWNIEYSADVYYSSTDDVALPTLVTTWTAVDGLPPVPVVLEGVITVPGTTLSASYGTYDAATGLLPFTIS